MGCYNSWANLRCSSCSPLGEKSFWNGTICLPLGLCKGLPVTLECGRNSHWLHEHIMHCSLSCVYARIGVYACMYMCTLMFLILICICILSSFHPHHHHLSPNSPRLMFLFVDCATVNKVYLILSWIHCWRPSPQAIFRPANHTRDTSHASIPWQS